MTLAPRVGALLLALLVVPVAAANACQERVAATLGLQSAVFEAESEYVGRPAATLRELVDARFGDGDGAVEAAEARAFEDAHALALSERCARAARAVLMDGSPPREGRLRVELAAAEGPARSDARLGVRVEARLSYAPTLQLERAARIDASDAGSLLSAARCANVALPSWTLGDHACGESGTDAVRSARVEVRAGPGARLVDGPLAFESRDDVRSARSAPIDARVLADPLLFIGGALGVGVAAALVLARPLRLRAALALLPPVAFARLATRDARPHPRRTRILEAVAAAPGLSLSDLQRSTGIPPGALAFHLRVLQAGGALRTVSDGFRTRVHLAGAPPASPYVAGTRRRVLDAVRERGPWSQTELARHLQLTRWVVAYHAAALARAGLIEEAASGGGKTYRAPRASASASPPERLMTEERGREGR